MTKPREPGDDYEVGYGKPPEATRFKPGQSGNPRGRPKKELDIRAMLEALTKREVSVVRNGRKIKMSSLEAMLQSNYSKALQGDARAFERFLALLAQHGVARPKSEEVEAAPLDADDDAILDAFLRRQRPMDDAA